MLLLLLLDHHRAGFTRAASSAWGGVCEWWWKVMGDKCGHRSHECRRPRTAAAADDAVTMTTHSENTHTAQKNGSRNADYMLLAVRLRAKTFF